MGILAGVYQAKKKDGSVYYRSSINYKNKHISLGSFDSEFIANNAYLEASRLLASPTLTIDDYNFKTSSLSFEKWVILVNFRDNGLYFKTPIYLRKRFFEYYYEKETVLKFDADDLFYYSNHKIMKRGGHLFVQDFGMQFNILSRYGIKNHAVVGKDYRFINGDCFDFRYENIIIINKYYGVSTLFENGIRLYVTKIHINGDYIVGKYNTETEAAIAYNKAAELLWEKGVKINYNLNFLSDIDEITYAATYNKIRLSSKILSYNI